MSTAEAAPPGDRPPTAADAPAERAREPTRPASPTRPRNPLRLTALIVVGIALLFFVLSIFMERRTPTSSQAVVQAYVIRMASEVTGRVIEVGVTDNARVAKGQVLFRIDPEPYEIAVREAEARLAQIGQSIGASTAAVNSAQAGVAEAVATRDNVREQSQRTLELVKRGVYAQARADQARSEQGAAEAAVNRATAELAKAREQLGPAGADNPQLKEALAALEKARLSLTRTTVLTPADGVITNLQLAVGQVVATGQAALTFIDANTIWIAAAYKENSLEFVSPGDQAEVVLDSRPGQIFTARVENVGWGVSGSAVDPATGLPTIRNDTGWVRDPQRFPVRLIFEGRPPQGIRYGSQASVVIYTGESNPGVNALGTLWIRIVSAVTYVS